MKKWIWFSFLILGLMLLLNCSSKRKGTAPANVPPEVFMANIPTDSSSFRTLTKVYWYGFDQDGYIARYQYLVVTDSGGIVPKSGNTLDSAFVQTIERVSPANWNDDSLSSFLGMGRSALHSVDSVKNPVGTWDNVRLFALLNRDSSLDQYFFVRAVDNEGAVSKIWKPESEKGSTFRRFSRTNIPPMTTISTADSLVFYCLPETTVDWKGIKVTWTAYDSDYSSRSQPSFSYTWQLFGPFDSPPTSADTTDATKIRYSSWDTTLGTPWVDSIYRVFVNLPNASQQDYGWYLFKVKARDDAFVPDPNPPTIIFKSIKPAFLFSPTNKRSVLLVDATNPYGAFIIPVWDSLVGSEQTPEQSFYKTLMQELKDSLVIDNFNIYPMWDPYPLPEDIFSQYKLVIFINEGAKPGIYGTDPADTGFVQIERYLRVGGRVWMIGNNNFGVPEQSGPAYVPITPGYLKEKYAPYAIRVANYFCGVTGAFLPKMQSDTTGGRNEEMIAAEPWDSLRTGLPRLDVEPAKLTKNYYNDIIPNVPRWDSLKGIPRAGYEGIWNTNYNERLYTFISYKGTNSQLHGRPCGSRAYSPNPWVFHEGGHADTLQWRTAEFSFAGLPMKRAAMFRMMRVMVNWFLQSKYPE